MNKDEIKAKLDEAGIEYDARLGADKLAMLLNPETMSEIPDEPEQKPDMVMVEVQRDFWPAENQRVRKGQVLEMTALEAIDGIQSGALRKV